MATSLASYKPDAINMLKRFTVEELPTVDVITATYRPQMTSKLIRHLNSQTVKIQNLVLSVENFTEEQSNRFISEIKNAVNIIILPVRVGEDGKVLHSLGTRHQEMVLECESECIACMYDDDWYQPNYLHSQLAYLKHTQADFVAKNKPVAMDLKTGHIGWLFPDGGPVKSAGAGGSMVFKRSLMEEFEFADVPIGYDSIFQSQLRQSGKRLMWSDPFNFIVSRNVATGHTWTPKEPTAYARNDIAFEDTIL